LIMIFFKKRIQFQKLEMPQKSNMKIFSQNSLIPIKIFIENFNGFFIFYNAIK
jgi:hypothetical protein